MKKILLIASLAIASILVIVSNSDKIFAESDLDLASANITSSSFDLNWNAITPSASSTLDYYEVFKDGTSIATTTGTTYVVTGLSASTTYVMKVDAVVLDSSSVQSVFKTDNATVTTSAPAPVVINITTVAELRDAIENQADGQTWNIAAGNYGLESFSSVSAGGQTGWYFPITANNLTINGAGAGNTTIYGVGYTANGNWATQNLVSIFGDNVTLDGITFMPKVQPNKTIEVLGNDVTIKNIVITPNTLTDQSEYDNALAQSMTKEAAQQWGGSLYFNHEGNHTVENVVINNAGISFRYSPSGTNIDFNNVQLVYTTNVNWINAYRYSPGFNNSGNATSGSISVIYHVNSTLNNLDSVLAAIQDGDTIELDSNISTNKQITITKAITINGNGNAITPTFTKTDNSNNSAIGVQADGVKINDLTVDGSSGTDLHGINVYEATGVELNNITAQNFRSGIVVGKGSEVTASNITTSGNSWHGINVDKAGSKLIIESTSNHNENGPDIYIDDKAIGQLDDVNDQYSYVDDKLVSGDRFYKLKLVAPTLISPADNSVVKGDSVTNVWSQVVGAVKYEYQSFNDSAATSLRWQQEFATTSKTATNVADSVFWWRVRGIDVNNILGAWSSLWKVTIDNTAPAAPTNLSWTTAKNNVIANGGTTKEVSGTASWDTSTSSDVDHYIYKYWNAIDGNQYKVGSEWPAIVYGTSLPGSFTEGEGTHYYCVVAVDAAGNESDCSDAFEITYTIDRTAPAAPTILAPTARQWLKTSPILNAWSEVTKDINGDDEEIDHYQIAYNYDDGHTFGGVNTCTGLVMTGVDGFIGCRNENGTSRSHQPADSEQGGVTVWVRAIDVDGNAGAWSKSVHYYFDKTAPATDINVSSVVDGKFTVSGTATDNLALNRVYVQLVSRTTNDRCGGTTVNLITSPFSTSSPWSVDYDIATLTVTGTSTACVAGDFAAHVSVVDMAGNSGTAGWTSNFTVTAPEDNGGGDNGGGDDNSTTTPPTTTPALTGGTGGGLAFTTAFTTPSTSPSTGGQVLGATAFQFTKDMRIGSKGEEVVALQKYLNLKGFYVAREGAGSPGNETEFFGPKTKAALIKYQEANPLILTNVGITNDKGTGNFFSSTRKFVNDILLNDSVTSAAIEN